MNAFYEHHKDSIRFGYRCFDRLLLNGIIQSFRQPERVLGFFNAYRDGKRVTRRYFGEIADQFQNWVKSRATKWGAPILEDLDEERRDEYKQRWVNQYNFYVRGLDWRLEVLNTERPVRENLRL